MNDVSNELQTSKQNIHYYSNKLRKHKLLKKAGYGTWELTQKGEQLLKRENKEHYLNFILGKVKEINKDQSLGMKKRGFRGIPLINYNKKTVLQQMEINIPIIKGEVDLTEFGGWTNRKFKNWNPQHLDLIFPTKMHIRNNNNKSITIKIPTKVVKKTRDVFVIASNLKDMVIDYFKDKGVELNKWNWRVENFDIEREDDIAEQEMGKGDKFSVKFNKNRKKITPNDPEQPSKAWLDSSPNPSLATNDLDFYEAYLKMPFRVEEINQITKVLTKESIETSKKFSIVSDILKANTEQMKVMIQTINTILPKQQTIMKETKEHVYKDYIG